MITIVLGTRPEIIKMAPVVRACEKLGVDYEIIHTGQHYSYDMDRTFFEQLELPDANHELDVGSGFHGEQSGKNLSGIEKVLMNGNSSEVLVQGDTNTVMAGALAASKLHIRVGHVEAGAFASSSGRSRTHIDRPAGHIRTHRQRNGIFRRRRRTVRNHQSAAGPDARIGDPDGRAVTG